MPPRPARRTPTLDRHAGREIFGSDAQIYDETRPGYPAALFEHLRERAVCSPRILEIGAGSGLATQGLLTLAPASVTVVESDPHFAAFLGSRFAHAPVRIVNAPFPAGRLEGPFDLAACAAAFHWLEPKPALVELCRLLRPGGVWAMWWNCYLNHVESNAFDAAVMEILYERRTALPPSFRPQGHISLDVEEQMALLAKAGLSDIVHLQWRRLRERDAGEVRMLFSTFSFVRRLPEPNREDLLDTIAGLVTDRFGGVAPCVEITSCYTARTPLNPCGPPLKDS